MSRGFVPPPLKGQNAHGEELPSSDTALRKRLAAILAADVEGYSRLMAADEMSTVALLDAGRAPGTATTSGCRTCTASTERATSRRSACSDAQ